MILKDCTDILDSITEPIIFISQKGKILYKNQEAENLQLYVGVDNLSMLIEDVINSKYIKDGINVKGLYKQVKNNHFQIDCYNYKDYLILFIKDITRLMKLDEEADREGKVTSFSKLLAELFHDLKGPIAGLKAAAQYLKENPSEIDLIDDMLLDINRIENYLKDVTNLTKPLNLSLRIENIHRVLDSIVNRFKSIYPNLNIIRNYDPSIPDAQIDVDYFQFVISNILQNAVDEVKEKGTIWIETGISSDPVYSPKRDKVYIRIKDSGNGVPDEIVDKIFLPFFSTKPTGTGIGLANAFKIIKQHNGVLRYIKDSTFEILLPGTIR